MGRPRKHPTLSDINPEGLRISASARASSYASEATATALRARSSIDALWCFVRSGEPPTQQWLTAECPALLEALTVSGCTNDPNVKLLVMAARALQRIATQQEASAEELAVLCGVSAGTVGKWVKEIWADLAKQGKTPRMHGRAGRFDLLPHAVALEVYKVHGKRD